MPLHCLPLGKHWWNLASVCDDALATEDPVEDEETGEDGVSSYSEWLLPSVQFEHSWGALHYDV